MSGVSLAVPIGRLARPHRAERERQDDAPAGRRAGSSDSPARCASAASPLDTASRRQLARRVAYVPQRPVLPAAMSVAEYVALGRTPYIALFGTESRHDRAVAAGVLERLDLDGLAGRELGSLSGGEAQRAVLGRALAQEAPLLLLDEPTAALDVGHGQQVLELVDELRDERRLTVVARCTTSPSPASSPTAWCSSPAGGIIAVGTAREVLTARLLARHYGAELRDHRGRLGGDRRPAASPSPAPARAGRGPVR